MYSLTAEPLPIPPPSAFTETSLKTISKNPDLFKITCLIHVNIFERHLLDHPNPLFCQSVITGLHDGFWPWPDKPEEYPVTHDNSHCPPKNDEERIFLVHQVLSEQKAGRLHICTIQPDLLPSMYSPPVHTIPKPSSEKLHMVVNYSTGKYSLNSMIDPKDITGIKLYGIHSLRVSLRAFRAKNPETNLVIFILDVGAAYCQMPIALSLPAPHHYYCQQ